MSDKHKWPPLLLFKNASIEWNIGYYVVMVDIYYQHIICGMDKVWILDMYLHFMEKKKHDFINLTTITFIPLKSPCLNWLQMMHQNYS